MWLEFYWDWGELSRTIVRAAGAAVGEAYDLHLARGRRSAEIHRVAALEGMCFGDFEGLGVEGSLFFLPD